jgi:hypothetical protein
MLRFTRQIVRQPLFQIDQPFQQIVMVVGDDSRCIRFDTPVDLGRPSRRRA